MMDDGKHVSFHFLFFSIQHVDSFVVPSSTVDHANFFPCRVERQHYQAERLLVACLSEHGIRHGVATAFRWDGI